MASTPRTQDPLGFGVLCPLRLTSTQDFATASGADLVKSDVMQLLGTVQGELPWRPDFGTRLTRLRHRQNTGALADLARIDVARALAKYEPRVRLRSVVSPAPSGPTANRRELHVHYEVTGKVDTAKTSF